MDLLLSLRWHLQGLTATMWWEACPQWYRSPLGLTVNCWTSSHHWLHPLPYPALQGYPDVPPPPVPQHMFYPLETGLICSRDSRVSTVSAPIWRWNAWTCSTASLVWRERSCSCCARCWLRLSSAVAFWRVSWVDSVHHLGDLESLCTSHTLLLMPNRGHTTVFHLTQQDLMTLDMWECESALSWEAVEKGLMIMT